MHENDRLLLCVSLFFDCSVSSELFQSSDSAQVALHLQAGLIAQELRNESNLFTSRPELALKNSTFLEPVKLRVALALTVATQDLIFTIFLLLSSR